MLFNIKTLNVYFSLHDMESKSRVYMSFIRTSNSLPLKEWINKKIVNDCISFFYLQINRLLIGTQILKLISK